MQRLGDAEYDLLIDGVLDDDPEALQRVPLLNPEEKEAMRGRVRVRKAQATPNVAGQRYLKLEQAGRAGGFPTTQGTMAPLDQRSFIQRATSAVDEGMSRAALPSKLLGELSQPPTDIAGTDAASGTSVGVPRREGALAAFGRGLAGAASTAAGAGEFMTGVVPGIQAASAVAKHFDPATERQGRQEITGMLQGAVAPIYTATDMVADPSKFAANLREHPGQAIADVGLTALGAVGAGHALKKGTLDALNRPDAATDYLPNRVPDSFIRTVPREPGTQLHLSNVPESTQGGPPPVEAPPSPQPVGQRTFPYFEAINDLRDQLAQGGVEGVRKGVGKGGEPISHPHQAVLDEAQLVHPNATRKQLKERLANDRDTLLQEIAMARAEYGTSNISGPIEKAIDPRRPINYPLGEYPSARAKELFAIGDRLSRHFGDRTKGEPQLPAASATGRPFPADRLNVPWRSPGAPPRPIPPTTTPTAHTEGGPVGGPPTTPQAPSRPLPPDAITWHGWQEGTKRVPAQDYWRLNQPLEGVTSRPGMVDGEQLRAAGYQVEAPTPAPGAPQNVGTPTPMPTSNVTPSHLANHFAPYLDANTPPITPSIARVGIDVAEPASRFGNAILNAGQNAAKLGGQLAQMSGGDPLKTTQWLNSITEGVADVVETQMYTRPRTYNEGRYVTPSMDEAATRHISANRSGYVMALQAWENGGPTEIFKRGTTLTTRRRIVKAREQAALKLIWDDRARAIEARGAEIEGRRAQIEQELGALKGSPDPAVNTHRAQLEAELSELPNPREHRYPKMNDQERAHVLTDPAMQDFANWFRDEWTPAAESMSTDAGINARLRGPLGGYVSFANAWLDPTTKGPHTLRGSGSRSPYDVRPRRPKSAKRATGAAPEELALNDNLFDYFTNTLTDRLTATTKNSLMDQIKQAAISTATIDSYAGKVAPTRTVIQTSRGPREVPVRKVTLEKLGGRTDDVYFVPEPYAHLYDMATKGPTKGELTALQKVSSAATAQVVVLPAEAVRHAWNVLSAVTTTEWFKQYGHTARAMEAITGMQGKMATALYKAYNLSGPELSSRIQRMADNNALRISGWPNTPEHQSLIMSAQKGRYNPLRVMKDYVFGYPGLDKGFKGLETRLRIAIEMAMEQMDPSMSDPQYARRINDNLGTYVKEVVPPLAEKLSAVYPFARARTALVKQGLRTATGMDILGHFNPYIATATASTIMQVLIANKALDDQHRWPWQVPGWKPLSLMMFEWNGRKVSIGADLIVNPLYRAASATGIRQATELALSGTHPVGDYLTEMARGTGNFLASWSGPLASSLMVAATGSVPYVGPDGKLYNIEDTTMSGAPEGKLHARYKALIKQAIPAMAKGREWHEATGHSPRPTTEPWNTLFGVSELFGVAPTISGVNSEQQAQSSNYFRTVEDARAVAFEALQRARTVTTDPTLQMSFMADYVARHTNPNMIVLDGKTPKPANIYAYELAIAAWKNQVPRRVKGQAMSGVNTGR